MEKLIEILKRQGEYARRSLDWINVDYRMPTVALKGREGMGEAFLQGDDAETFVSAVEAMYEQAQVLTKDECEFIVAHGYLDILG